MELQVPEKNFFSGRRRKGRHAGLHRNGAQVYNEFYQRKTEVTEWNQVKFR